MVLESSLAGNSQFLGRDGFKWWVGQVAPLDAQSEQLVNGEGWSHRYKVRIMGYHPFTEEIPNEELPWGQALLLQAGSGAANYADSTKIQQGDMVYGFFLDGDEAQMPMILGQFPRTQYVANGDYSSPFAPYGAYTADTPQNGRVPESENNEQARHSQPTPSTQGTKKDQAGSGARQLTADTCQTNPITEMASVVENLAGRVEQLALAGSNLKNEIRLASDIIEIQFNRFVGTLIEKLFDKFETLGQAGLEALYRLVYARYTLQLNQALQHT